MTALDVYTDWFPKSRMEFFTDLVSTAAPFGTVLSSNGGVLPTVVYSNKNEDEFGSVTFTLPATVTTGYPRAGMYLTQSISGSVLNRNWFANLHDCAFESRIKASLSANAPTTVYLITSGFSLNHNSATAGIAQDMVGFYSYGGAGGTWKAAVVNNYVLIKEIDTGIPISSYCTLRTELSAGGTKASMIANGRTVMKYSGTAIADAVSVVRYLMPCVELRDRVATGSNGANRSYECDYLYYTENVRR